MKKTLIILLPVILIVSLIGWFMMNNQTSQPQTNQPTPMPQQTVSNDSGMRVESNSVYVSGQGESDSLTVTMVTLVDPGYVVIHSDNNGKPGAVLGKSELLPTGTQNNAPIKLSRKTVNGEIIYAALYRDNGDKKHTSDDEPVRGANGEPMMMNVTVDDAVESSPDAVSL